MFAKVFLLANNCLLSIATIKTTDGGCPWPHRSCMAGWFILALVYAAGGASPSWSHFPRSLVRFVEDGTMNRITGTQQRTNRSQLLLLIV